MTLRKQKRPKLKKGVRVTILLLVVLSGILVYQAGGKAFFESLIRPVVSLSEQLTHQPDSELKQQWQDILTDQDANVTSRFITTKLTRPPLSAITRPRPTTPLVSLKWLFWLTY